MFLQSIHFPTNEIPNTTYLTHKKFNIFCARFLNHEGVCICVKCVILRSAAYRKYIYYTRNIKIIVQYDRPLATPRGHTSGQFSKPKHFFEL
jgi:hypothetical protein